MDTVATRFFRQIRPIIKDQWDIVPVANRQEEVGGHLDNRIVDILNAKLEGSDITGGECVV
jgi:hypothetical protein